MSRARFLGFPLDQTTQAVVLSREGACLVNIPSPQRYAVHKLIVYGERPVAQRVKSAKAIEQAAAMMQYFLASSQPDLVAHAWTDAVGRGKGWQRRAEQGRRALLSSHPELAAPALWQHNP